MFTFQALQIAVFLVPGILATAFLDALVVRKPKSSQLDKFLEALVLSLVIYTPYALIAGSGPIALAEAHGSITVIYSGPQLLLLFAITILVSIVLAISANHDWHLKLARALKITRRTAKASVWFDAFHGNSSYVVLNFSDSRRLYGWPTYYSDDPSTPFVYIEKPYWIRNGKFIDAQVHGVLVTPEEKIEFIEFLH